VTPPSGGTDRPLLRSATIAATQTAKVPKTIQASAVSCGSAFPFTIRFRNASRRPDHDAFATFA
jgi:hypothetical protein